MAALLLATGAWARVTRYDWNRAAPAAVLIWRSTPDDRASAGSATAELFRRFDEGRLSRAHRFALVDKALKVQAARGDGWLGLWDRVVAKVHVSGELTQGQLAAYARSAILPRAVHRSTLRADQDWCCAVVADDVLVAGPNALAVQVQLKSIAIDGVTRFENRTIPGRPYPLAPVDSQWVLHQELRPGMPLGVHQVRTTLSVSVYDATKSPPVLVHEGFIEADSTVRAVGPSEEVVRPVVTDGSRAALHEAIRPRELVVWTDPAGPERCRVLIDLFGAPVAMSFDVICRVEGRDTPFGGFAALPQESGVKDLIVSPAVVPMSERLDVVLRPNPRWLEMSFQDEQEYWGEEILLQGVPVRRITDK